MKPVLGILSNEDSNPHYEHSLTFTVDLAWNEFEEYLHAKDTLNDFYSNAQLFKIVILNCQEYYDALSAGLDAYIDKDKEAFDYRQFHLEINRYFLNWLSSVRTYLDHTETTIKRKYGIDSLHWHIFEQSRRTEYDDNFSYRFLYRMRNYAQHCGFPITEINFSAVPSDSDQEKVIYTVEVGCKRDTLLTRFKEWKQPLKTEIPKLPSFIDINEHINSMMRSLEKINLNNITQEFSELQESAVYIKNLFQRVKSDQGNPEVFEIEVIEDESGKIINISQIVTHITPVGLVDAVINGKLEDFIGDFIIETI